MENFELTKDMMKRAITYMPLAEKTIYAELIARRCLKPIKPLKKDDNIESFLIIPSVVGEDILQKEQMLLNVLLSHYFDIKLPQINADLYDKYMGSHFLNQLERFKGDPEYKTKAFDILTDFKTIKKMVDIEIYNYKTKENDIAERVLKGLSLWSAERMTNDPEYLKKMTEEIKRFAETAKQVNVGVADNAITADEEETQGE